MKRFLPLLLLVALAGPASSQVVPTSPLNCGNFPALTGDVTSPATSCTTTLTAGSASNLNSGTLPAARMPALTGDCTTTVGTIATTCTGINGINQNAAWTTYTPSLACGTGTLTTASATGRQKTLGKTVFWEATVTITTNNTCATNLQIGLPAAAASFIYTANGVETALTNKAVSCNIGAGASVCLTRFYDSTYPAANGSVISISGVYEIP